MMILKIIVPSFLALFFFVNSLQAADVLLNSAGFEAEAMGQSPLGWKPFHASAKPKVTVADVGSNHSLKSLKGTRSNSGGWTALSREIDASHERIMVEFYFAYSKTNGRCLNIWTHEPGGKDASQLNLCIQGGALMQYDGRTRSWEEITRNIQPTLDPAKPVWHRLRVIIDAKQPGIDFWVSQPNSTKLPEKPVTRQAYRTNLPIGAIDIVSGTRIAEHAWYLIDDLVITGGDDLPATHGVEPLTESVTLWTGPAIPTDIEKIPFVNGVQHQTIHQATADGYKFLHGAAIVHYQGTLYANWANSPVHENGPHETLQGRRSSDGGKTWSEIEIIGPGFKDNQRHSHGVLFVHQGELWTICARFGVGEAGRKFDGLQGEAFVLNQRTDRWESRGIVMKNCWPYDEPVQMSNGNYITGGQDKDGLPVVAISNGDDLLNWESKLIPFDPRLKPSYAETTVWAEGKHVLAVIRGGSNVAWVSTSDDNGETWTKAAPSNMPMPRAKAYLGKLSTGQLYLVSNLKNRDTLAISVSQPNEMTLSKIWRIRHGKSVPPRFTGSAKGKQWSYPYGYEHDGKLFVLYSIGKEDCGMSVIPISSLQ